MSCQFGEVINHGKVYGKNLSFIEELEWNPHPAFPGVHLKHIVQGQETHGCLSLHLVRVQAGYDLKEHIHPDSWELHEVVDGAGTAKLLNTVMEYIPGTTAVIPCGEKHEVHAEETLFILAIFTPALL